ncbi:hypothetical protein NZK35_20735 [Stieleria sp. ICT_E10.1]|uniref:hypothetical protein n=1 Tax=Stieleria sedimenti TaxID=2976331 RepID=UPI00217F30EC|nr:hypothetical protein [Stieleria sedimenti]MCS7469086.1 hypothetical protein [Stieleria sedimenti]
MDSWFQMLSPAVSFRLPASGDVSMAYNPWTNWGISRPKSTAGNPEIEAEVYLGVATPGKQLGKLTDATMALAKLVQSLPPELLGQDPSAAEAIEELKDLAAEIERTKEKHKESAKAEAMKVMERFKQTDPPAYQTYLNDLRKADVC